MSERSAVQNPLLQYADEIGWDYISPGEALYRRGGQTSSLYFADILQAQLIKLNPGIITPDRAIEILRRLNLLTPGIEGNWEALKWMRGEQSIFVSEANRELNITLIDFEHPDRNLFHVTDEWTYKGPAFTNRADVMFLINGIPVAITETKSLTLPNAINQGFDQIRRYHKETPQMLVPTQVFEVTQMLDFYYGVTWNTTFKNLFNWKEEQDGDFETKVKAFFQRDRFLKILKDYIIFLNKDDTLSKVILRQHQTRAVEKVIERVHDPRKRRGLVWHTQGSGKTLTMITIAANLLRGTQDHEKPTILMLVDRNELEAQLFKNIASYGIQPKEAKSKKDLRDILASDYRGLVLSMIHKFDDIPAQLNTRQSIVVLVDEAHRTTGGDLGNYLMAALPNATYIGFTGTPIDKLSKGQGTFKVFGADDERGYLDKYSIRESIADGTTVQLNYALAPSNLKLPREILEKEFLNLQETEGVSDVEELNTILDKAVNLKEALKSDKRIDQVAAYVAQHFRENVEPMGFKAFLVAVDREACMLYKRAIDQYLPPEYSRVVYSSAPKDPPEMKAYHLSAAEEKQLRKDFIDKTKQPKIFIVTEKLLTGFDAPILYCLYLDKPMRDHVLLQTIARVNRPYEDNDGLTKPYGFVLDFIGIFEKLEKALAFDPDEVTAAIENIDVLKALFIKQMQEDAPQYLSFTIGWDDKAKEKTITAFQERSDRERFLTLFKRLQNLYEILSPDPDLRPYMDDYQALSQLYTLLQNAYSDRTPLNTDLTSKTKELLRQHADLSNLEPPGAIHELGAAQLAALKQGDYSDVVKVLNLRKILTVTVNTETSSKPYLLPIGERADELAKRYEERQISTQEALAEFEKLAQESANADAQRQTLDVDENTFAIYTVIQLIVDDFSVTQAANINELFLKFPDHGWDEQQQSKLRTELYKVLRGIVGPGKMVNTANALLKLKRV
ncbi:MAG: HsdR family type I site-specific deoxyribonuclease [Leptolyngbyaceae cyanobacterium bins.349]|nr:HsdR family type I site-specific deoxyribonuclease [Leptolyngbyaceae cyanobacterium bins.349]